MNAAEDRLAELMDAATRALNPPVQAILAEGERLGRVRRRRRVAVAAGTAVAVLLAAGAGAVAARTARDSRLDAAGAVPATRSAAAAATALPESRAPAFADAAEAAKPAPSQTRSAATVPINAAAAVAILRQLVASGWKFGTYPASSPGSVLRVDVDDGKGLAQIFVDLAPAAASGMDPIDCSRQTALTTGGGKRPAGADPASCAVASYANGDKAMQEVLKADSYGEYLYRIIVDRSDGVVVEITAANGDWNNPKTEVTRARPPLSVAQWTAVALDRLWQLRVPAKYAE
jgi:nucleoid-associated protein YgaU